MASTNQPTFVRILTNSYKASGPERNVQIVLTPNEDKLLVVWHSEISPGVPTGTLAYMDTTTGNALGSAIRIRDQSMSNIKLILGLNSVLTFSDDAILFVGALKRSGTPLTFIGYLGFDGNSFSTRDTFTVKHTTDTTMIDQIKPKVF